MERMIFYKNDIVRVSRRAGYRKEFIAVVEGTINHTNGEVVYQLRDQHGGVHRVFGQYLFPSRG